MKKPVGNTAFPPKQNGNTPPGAGERAGDLNKLVAISLNEVAWYGDNSRIKTHPVGQKKPNELGLYDLSGNVWELCADWYGSDYYKNSPKNNPTEPVTGSDRVIRGGSWVDDADFCRVSGRYLVTPDFRDVSIGFRLLRTP